jgi:hypothetical protein
MQICKSNLDLYHMVVNPLTQLFVSAAEKLEQAVGSNAR